MILNIPKAVESASKRIGPFIRKTYFTYSHNFSDLLNADVRFKMENLQITGSFKARGAVNKLLSLSEKQREKGVVSASTGNHGAAVAYAAQKLNVPCSIFVCVTCLFLVFVLCGFSLCSVQFCLCSVQF